MGGFSFKLLNITLINAKNNLFFTIKGNGTVKILAVCYSIATRRKNCYVGLYIRALKRVFVL